MTTMPSEMKMKSNRKIIVRLILAGIVGGIAGYFSDGLWEAEAMRPDQVAVIGVGLAYMVMGLIIAFGLIAPKLGSRILNVQDSDEIRELSRTLTGPTIFVVALGAALIALPMAGPDGPILPLAGFGGLLAALAIMIVISIREWKHYDEMMLQLNRDAGNLAFCGIGSVILIWSAAAWLGLTFAPTPLALVAVVSGGPLLAMFVAIARKGLLRPH